MFPVINVIGQKEVFKIRGNGFFQTSQAVSLICIDRIKQEPRCSESSGAWSSGEGHIHTCHLHVHISLLQDSTVYRVLAGLSVVQDQGFVQSEHVYVIYQLVNLGQVICPFKSLLCLCETQVVSVTYLTELQCSSNWTGQTGAWPISGGIGQCCLCYAGQTGPLDLI